MAPPAFLQLPTGPPDPKRSPRSEHRSSATSSRPPRQVPWKLSSPEAKLLGGFNSTHLKNMIVKLGSFSQGENKNYLKPPPRKYEKKNTKQKLREGCPYFWLSFLVLSDGSVGDLYWHMNLIRFKPQAMEKTAKNFRLHPIDLQDSKPCNFKGTSCAYVYNSSWFFCCGMRKKGIQKRDYITFHEFFSGF